MREPRFTGSAGPAKHIRTRSAGQKGREPDEKTMVARVPGLEPDTKNRRGEFDGRFENVRQQIGQIQRQEMQKSVVDFLLERPRIQ